MSNTKIPKAPKSIRYTDAQKKEVVDFASSYNAANGRGGQSKAAEKFKISQITIAGWLKSANASTPKADAKVKAPKPAKAAKAAKAVKAPKTAKAPKPAKAPKAAKAAGKVKVAKNKVGKRYTPEQKAEITGFVTSYNAANGRGGQSKAAEKFNVSPLTIMAWLKASGKKTKVKKSVSKTAKSPTATISSAFDVKLASLLALSKEISKAEAALAQMNARFKKMKAAL
jgi:transposase-like protein